MGVRQNKSKASVVRVKILGQRALELRMGGTNYTTIGTELGISRSRAHQLVWEELHALNAENREKAEELQRLELGRLDRYLERLEPKIRRGIAKAIEVAIKLHEKRARLLGLEQPQQVQVSGGVAFFLPEEAPEGNR